MSEHKIYHHELVDGLKDQAIQFIDAMATINSELLSCEHGHTLYTIDAVITSINNATAAFTGLLTKAMLDCIDAESERRDLLRILKERRQNQQEKSYQQASANGERKGK